jgi:hypothetical protein
MRRPHGLETTSSFKTTTVISRMENLKHGMKIYFGKIEKRTVHLLAGKMGAGKSSNHVSDLCLFHRDGYPAWINYPLKRELPDPHGYNAPVFYYDDPRDMPSMGRWIAEHYVVPVVIDGKKVWEWKTRTFEEGKEDDEREGFVGLDEAALVKGNREFAKFTKEDLAAFVNIRKLHLTAQIIAQGFAMTDLNIRRVATDVRIYEGGKLGGRLYPFTEYAVDENGEIIKNDEEVEYLSARRGRRFFTRDLYDLYDTDHLFADAPAKTWPSAVGYVPQYLKASSSSTP